jgi:basic amino acid/polyamine antiporter, APA family
MAISSGSDAGVDAGEPQARAFIRRSSGLVRDVSPLNALFFSMAAVFGGGIAFTFQGMTATAQPLWQFAGLTAYAWSAIAVAAACALLGVLYANLSSAMPRAGANYVFTSRILSPFLAWLESWAFVIAILAVAAVFLPLVLLMFNLSGTVMSISFPESGLWDGAPGWFSTPDSQFIGGTVLIGLACLFAILPNQLFHRALTSLGIVAVIAVALMVIALPLLSQDTFLRNVVELTGQTPAAIIEAGAYPEGGFDFLGFMALCAFILFVFVGFQYAAFISGEMAGSVKRSTYIAVLGSLAIVVFISSFYNDLMAAKFGLDLTAAWSFLFWTGGDAPGGVMASPPTLGAIANPDLWPIWLLCGLVAAVFTFLLIPVWFTVAARVLFAWSMDRQAPEVLGRVNQRTNAPLNAIVLCAVACEAILYLSSYQGLELGSTLWLSTLLFGFAWIMPGFNAIFARRRRPELFAQTPTWLPWVGAAWLVAILLIYATSVFKPLWEGLTGDEESAGSYLSSSGVLAALIVVAVGVVLYFVNVAWNQSRGVERTRVFTAIPPD